MIINLGDAPFKAFITVNYPSGKCEAKHEASGVSYTHTGGGPHTFTVHKKGKWIVTATPATGAAKTSEVTINTRGEEKPVSFSYELVLFENGKLASGYNLKDNYIAPAIDLSQYTSLEVTAKISASQASTDLRVGFSANPSSLSYDSSTAGELIFSDYFGTQKTKTSKINSSETLYFGVWNTLLYKSGSLSISNNALYSETSSCKNYIYKIVLR